MDKAQYFNHILVKELIESTGCTEPSAIAYAASVAASRFDKEISNIEIYLSSNVLKNAFSVIIPGTKHSGIELAVSAGILFGNQKDKLDIFSKLTEEQLKTASNSEIKSKVNIHVKDQAPSLYIEIVISDDRNNYCKVVISDRHDFIKTIKTQDYEFNAIFDENLDDVLDNNIEYNFNDILKFVREKKLNTAPVARAKELNNAIMKEGLAGDYGMGIGLSLSKKDSEYGNLANIIMSRTAAAIDARMGGSQKPVVINSGSGNQGIAATISIMELAKILRTKAEDEYLALAMSSLTTIYIKSKQNKLSSMCGIVGASAGAAAGMTYLFGGTDKQIEEAIKNVLSSNIGMFCDGAKQTCALKGASCVSSALISSKLAMNNSYINHNNGIIDDSLDSTIISISNVEKVMTDSLDKIILEEILGKQKTYIKGR